MTDTTKTVRLLGFPGSLRRASYSLAVLRGLQAGLPGAGLGDGVELAIRDLRLPLYDQDEDGPNSPDSVRSFRQAIADSDGLVIVTPEYNYGMPGVLKNALDWASRPYGQAAIMGKPALVISASPAFTGGVRAQAQVNETLLAVQAVPVPGPQVVIGGIADKVRDGTLVDEAGLRFALSAVGRLVALARQR